MAAYPPSSAPTAAAPAPFAWGTCEELLLASAVKRHGPHSWALVSSELQSRAMALNLPPSLFSPQACESKFLALNGRYSTSCDRDGDLDNSIPWLEELRKLRVAQLRKELEVYDNSIRLLLRKLRKLKAEKMDASVTYKPYAKSSASNELVEAEVECLEGGLEVAKETQKTNHSDSSLFDSQFEQSLRSSLEPPSVAVQGCEEPVIVMEQCNERDNFDLGKKEETEINSEAYGLVLKEGERDSKDNILLESSTNIKVGGERDLKDGILLESSMNIKVEINSNSGVADTCTSSLDLSSTDLNIVLLKASEVCVLQNNATYNSPVAGIKSESEAGFESSPKDASLDLSYCDVTQVLTSQSNCPSIVSLPSSSQCNDLTSMDESKTTEAPANCVNTVFCSISTTQEHGNKGTEEISCLVGPNDCYSNEPASNFLESAVEIDTDVSADCPKLDTDANGHNPSNTLEISHFGLGVTDTRTESTKVENGLLDEFCQKGVVPDRLVGATSVSASAIDLLRLAYGSIQDISPISTPEATTNSDLHVAEATTTCQELMHCSDHMALRGELCLAADYRKEPVQNELGVSVSITVHTCSADAKEDVVMIDHMSFSQEGIENVKNSLDNVKTEFQETDITTEQVETQYSTGSLSGKLEQDLHKNILMPHIEDTSTDQLINRDIDFQCECNALPLECTQNVCSPKVVNSESNDETGENEALAPQISLYSEIPDVVRELDERDPKVIADETMYQQGSQAEAMDVVKEIDGEGQEMKEDGTMDQWGPQTTVAAQNDCLQTSTVVDEIGDIYLSNKEIKVEDFHFKQVSTSLTDNLYQSQMVKFEILEDKSQNLCSQMLIDNDNVEKHVNNLESNCLAPLETNADSLRCGDKTNESENDKHLSFSKEEKGLCEPESIEAEDMGTINVASIAPTKCEADMNSVLECNMESQSNMLADHGGALESQRNQKVLSDGNDSGFGNETREMEPGNVESHGSIKCEEVSEKHLEHDIFHSVGCEDELFLKLHDKCKVTEVKGICFAQESMAKGAEEIENVAGNEVHQVLLIHQDLERKVSMPALPSMLKNVKREVVGSLVPEEEVNETNPHETSLFPMLRMTRAQTTGRLKSNRSVRGKGVNLNHQSIVLKGDTILNSTAGTSDIGGSRKPFVSEVVTRRRTRSRQLISSMSIGTGGTVSNSDIDQILVDSKIKPFSRGREARTVQQEICMTSNEDIEEDLLETRDNDSQLEKSEVGSVADGTDDTSPISSSRRRESKVPGKLIPFLQCLRRLCAHKFAPLFKQKQESQTNHHYDLLIRRHMDLSIVRSRLEKGSFSGSLEFFRDLLLIFNNALVFYSRDSHEYGAALALRECVMKEMEKIFQTEALLQNAGPATRKREPRKRSVVLKGAYIAINSEAKRRVSSKSCNNEFSVCESTLDHDITIKGRQSGPEVHSNSKRDNLRERKPEGNRKAVTKASRVSGRAKHRHVNDRVNNSQEKNTRSVEDIDASATSKNDLDDARMNSSQVPGKANEETLCAEFGIKPSKLAFLRHAMTTQTNTRKRVGRPRNSAATGDHISGHRQKRAKI